LKINCSMLWVAAAPLFITNFFARANPITQSFLLQSGLGLLLHCKKHAKIRNYRHIINSADCKEFWRPKEASVIWAIAVTLVDLSCT
jgi:hypothetical protein